MGYTMTEKYTIGRNIRLTRKENGITQRELAERAQMSQTQLSDYENGKKEPGLYSLARIARALNKSIDELFFGNKSVSFITSAPDKGSAIVNCIVELWDKKVIDIYTTLYGSEVENDEVVLWKHGYAIRRLLENLYEFDQNKGTYPNPEDYLEMIKHSVANEINSRL